MEAISSPRQFLSMLLVEDEEDALKLLATIIVKKYPNVVLYTAINGIKGLELFKAHTPDIVITDINMPEMNGVQMTKEFRLIKPDTKFIVLTGDSGKLFSRDSDEKEAEFDYCIVKPVGFSQLFAAIERCIVEISQQT